MLRGDANAQHSREDAKAQRWIEQSCLAIDAGGDRAVGMELKCRARPLLDAVGDSTAVAARATLRPDPGDPQAPAVKPWSGPGADGMPKPVAVVGDEHGRAGRLAIPPTPVEVWRLRIRSDDVRDRVQQRSDLGLPITGSLYRLRVEAER